MHMDPILPTLVGVVFAVLLIGLFLRRLNQPSILGYLIAGVVLGPSGFGVAEDPSVVTRMGEIGVVLLLFFAGMEVSLPRLIARWQVPVLGTLLQIAASVGCALAIGAWQDWPLGRIILIGFVISLSSTAVILKLLHDRGELEQPIGRDVVGIILVQDLAVIPMLITIGMLGGKEIGVSTAVTQAIGGIAVVALLIFLARREEVHLPFGSWLRADKEIQVFGAFALGFGLAFLTGLAGLSVALGAFLAGIIAGASRETDWVHEVLYPFQVLFLAIFFVSVGMMLDLSFIVDRLALIALLVAAALVINTVINCAILRVLGRTWRNSLYGGALLSQIGEFSFVLAAVGVQAGLIAEFAYQVAVAVIALSLLISPLWIAAARRLGSSWGQPQDEAPSPVPPSQPLRRK